LRLKIGFDNERCEKRGKAGESQKWLIFTEGDGALPVRDSKGSVQVKSERFRISSFLYIG